MIGERIYSGLWSEDAAGYARAVIDPPYVFVSGTTGFDPETKSFPESVEEQTENCFRTIEAALKKAGTDLSNLLRVRIFVTSKEEFERILPIVKRHCDAARPANTTVISELVSPDMRVEVEVTAKIPPHAIPDYTR